MPSQNWFANHVKTSQYFTQIVKCMDGDCCSPPRSSYFSVIPSRFMPPPIPLLQTPDGLKAPERSEFHNHKFSSLFLALNLLPSIHSLLPRSTRSFKVIPYDLYNPTVQSQLFDRICKKCSLYFASKVMLKTHMITHSANDNLAVVNTRVQPIRVAARRQRELMVIISQQENGMEDAEWIDEEHVDIPEGVSVPSNRSNDSNLPIVTIEDHFSNPWEDDDD